MKSKIVRLSGPVVIASDMPDAKMFDVVRVGDEKLLGEVIKLEADLILKKIPSDSFLIICDMAGDKVSSSEFSKIFENLMHENTKVCFVIGGSFGLSEELKLISNKVLSASNFTFPHRLFRIILVEQIYRAISIINNAPYHK